MQKKLLAEFIGTFVLLTAVCGAALFSAPAGGGLVSVALAVGLSVAAMAYAVGHLSGGHFNPAVTIGLWAAGRCERTNVGPYIFAQCLGGIAAAGLFSIILDGATTRPGLAFNNFSAISNNYGEPGYFTLQSVAMTEFLTTAVFVFIIVAVTTREKYTVLAPLVIGLTLTMLHLISIPITNASLNPARSLATALYAEDGAALKHLWVFIVAPITGAMFGGLVSSWLQKPNAELRGTQQPKYSTL